MKQRFDFSRFSAELRQVTRRLLSGPAFTVTAVLLLGSGLGVGTAFFNLVNGALLKPLANTDKFVRLNHVSIGSSNWSRLSEAEIKAVLNDPPASFASINGHGSIQTTAVIRGMPQPVKVDIVMGHYFEDLAALPLSGRLLGPADQGSGAVPAAVVSERIWQTAMAGDPGAVGSVITVAGQQVTIVGVMAPSFKGLFSNVVAADLWISSRVLPVQNLFGVLRPDISFDQANAEIRTRYAGRARAPGGESTGLEIEHGLQSLPPGLYVVVVAILAIGGIVAAIAAASLTLLLLARAATNQGEIAVRLALGASVRDISRLVALEVAVVCTMASIVGLALASILANGLARYFITLSEVGTLALDASPDWRVFLYMTAAAFAIAFGISVVLGGHSSRVGALSSMSAAGGAGGATPQDGRTRTRLIASQVVVVTMLLFLSALFARSTAVGLRFDPGFNSTGLAIAWIDQAPSRGDALRALAANRRVLDAVRDAPGVVGAGLTTRLPGSASHTFATKARGEAAAAHWAAVQGVTSEFFEVIRVPIVRGRGFARNEESDAAVAVVSERIAAQFWPRRDPLGQRLWFPDDKTFAAPVQVIGVVADIPVASGQSLDGDIFIPFGHRLPNDAVAVIVRTLGPSQAALDILRATARSTEPPIGFLTSHTVDDELARGVGPAKLVAGVSAMLGLVGLFIALAGLYGITAQLAAHRRKELGIRKALGATNVTLCRMLAVESTRILFGGIAPGLLFGLLVGFTLRQRWFPNLEPSDWVVCTTVSALVLTTGLIAAVLPFRRVLRDHYAALREL